MSEDLAQAMRNGMRRLASGVSVVAVNDKDLGRVAMTASSVTSVSDSPPSLLVCINAANRLAYSVEQSQTFSINVLSASHEGISRLCAGGEQGECRFTQGDWRVEEETALPYLFDAEAVFFCEKGNVVRHGTHDIVIGNIRRVLVNPASPNPLVYLDGGYRRLVAGN